MSEHECPFCGMGYRYAQSLKTHMKREHQSRLDNFTNEVKQEND